MASPKADRYTEISQRLIRQAQEELDRGDLIQASEKSWGAVAHSVKTIAQERGWNHGRHDLLGEIVSQIADERGRPDLHTLFAAASNLHHNFYEHLMENYRVQALMNDAKTLIGELEAFRAEPPGRFTPQTRDQHRRLQKLTRSPGPTEDDVSDLPPVNPVPPGEK
jgi:hypothetical protein